MTFYHLTERSSNRKLGPMPVSTISSSTCPTSCPFINGGGCYADLGPLSLHWNRISSGERGENFSEFLDKVRKMPDDIWRYAQAGDLPGEGDKIDAPQMAQLVEANAGRPVLCYTHKPLTEDNAEAIRSAAENGFHINISTESLSDCDKVIRAGFSAVTVLPASYQRGKNEDLEVFKERTRNLRTPAGVRVAICPATYLDTDCKSCRACSKQRAGHTVIAFPAHGSRKRKVSERIEDAHASDTVGEGSG